MKTTWTTWTALDQVTVDVVATADQLLDPNVAAPLHPQSPYEQAVFDAAQSLNAARKVPR